MLAYTINKLLDQKVSFERDRGARDKFGGETGRMWQPLSTVACKAWWGKQSTRGPGKEEATPSETVPLSMGGMLVPGGTDVTNYDRIAAVTDRAGKVLFAGPMHIVSVNPHASYPGLVELAFKNPD